VTSLTSENQELQNETIKQTSTYLASWEIFIYMCQPTYVSKDSLVHFTKGPAYIYVHVKPTIEPSSYWTSLT